MLAALPAPAVCGLFTRWTVQPVALAVVLVLAVSYGRALRRQAGRPWPAARTAGFVVGLALLAWTSCGFLQVYSDDLYWVWTTQALVLWLFVPILVLAGHPVQLARASGGGRRIGAVLASRPVRILGNPLVGPALVPLLSGVIFFGPLPRWTIEHAAIGWVFQLVLLVIGAVMALPLVGLDEEASSLAVGLSLAIGAVELVLDALPGVVLRLHDGVATSWFHARATHPWTPAQLHDQRLAGGILWTLAEVIDLPFLVLVFRRWLRADARDAARVDAVLEAERAARRGLDADAPDGAPAVERDVPWWLTDPALRDRLGRGE